MTLLHIGNVRRSFFLKGSHKWNGWVRDFTAWLELQMPWLIGS